MVILNQILSMKTVKFLVFFLLVGKSIAQIMPYQDLFFWDENSMALNKVKKVTGYY